MDNKVWVRLIPRIDQSGFADKRRNPKAKFAKIPQRPNFRAENLPDECKQTNKHPALGRYMYCVKSQYFHKGFHFRCLPFK